MTQAVAIEWQRKDYSRVPQFVYHDAELYRLEQEKIFQGACWSFLGLDVEIPNAGDFRTTYIGDTPVIYNRGNDGRVYAFVNRCVHKGAMVRREVCGNAKSHTCIYHQWCYDLEGKLTGIPFRRGVKGKGGGLSEEFDPRQHPLRSLRVESFHGILFCTFSDETESLVQYLGPSIAEHLARLMSRKIRVLGYQRQRVQGNWKIYAENLRDLYHGSLLHEFLVTVGVNRFTMEGGTKVDPRHRHNISWGREGTDSPEEAAAIYKQENVPKDRTKLRNARLVHYYPEWEDRISVSICSTFPNGVFQQIRNSLATRQIRTKGLDEFELFWTIFGFEDDDEKMTQHRLRQSNLIGPAGYVSLEDAEAVEIVHRATVGQKDAQSIIEMGGVGEISDRPFRVTEVSVRGFWSYYSELLGIEPEGAIR
jgi:anthranilate 1,2-dioxygenase large subunit